MFASSTPTRQTSDAHTSLSFDPASDVRDGATSTIVIGRKHDMGGSAGVLGGFFAAVRLRTKRKIRLLLCLAENAIGPKSIRNDDIITLYSGKTVEINNSDAEGRLVLSDAVAHATRHYADDTELVVDMATLTGAQLILRAKSTRLSWLTLRNWRGGR